MSNDTTPASDTSRAPTGNGFLLTLAVASILTLIWGAYTIWVSFEILSQAPRA